MKKVICLFLSLVMSICVTAGMNISVYAASNYESEDNNNYSCANVVTAGNSISGTINNYDDKDCYKIVAPSNGQLSISFKHTYEDSPIDWGISLFYYNNGSYTELSKANIGLCDNEIIKLPYIGAIQNAIYYIKVEKGWYSPDDVIGKNYTIQTSFKASDYYEKELNNVYSTATNAKINNSYSGTINNYDDKDYYKIIAPSNGQITISFKHTYEDSPIDWCVALYRYNKGEYTELSKVNIGLCDNEIIKLPYIGAIQNGVYYVKVEKGWYSPDDVIGKNYSIGINFNINPISALKVSTRNTTSLKLSWSKVGGVSGYQLQRKSGDSYKTLVNTTSTSYTAKKLKAGTTYSFRVRAYKTIDGKKYYSSWKTLKTPTKPSRPSIKTPSTNKKHQIIAKWGKVTNCSGYQVQYSKKKSFSSVIATRTVSGSSKTSYTGKNFTKGKTYYVRVRSYKTVDGKKYYSSWSSVKSIKCK